MAGENIIYHYCSLSTFLTIIKKKTLRLTNVLKSNDALERKYAVEECENCIIDAILKCIQNYGTENIDLEQPHKISTITGTSKPVTTVRRSNGSKRLV